MKCETCEKDQGFCVYCQRQFASTGRLHRHIQTQHPVTIRAQGCTEMIAYGGSTSLPVADVVKTLSDIVGDE